MTAQTDTKDKDREGVIEGTFTEKPGAVLTERTVVVRTATPQDLAQWSPQFEKEAVDRAVVQVREKTRFFSEVMKSGSHYAIIPGQKPTPRIDQQTGQPVVINGVAATDPPKPALLKPGAELLLSAMALHPELVDELVDEDWSGEKHAGEPFFRYRRRCNIWRQTGPGPEDRMLIASASGEAHSWEEKHRYRGQSGRTCPNCNMASTVRKGSAQFAPRENGRTGPVIAGYENGGFYCWKKIDGCGATFADKDERITSQDTAKEKHPNPADLTNTLLKMADKRALVAATLLATGCSDLFTQDIEENKAAAGEPAAAAPPEPPVPPPANVAPFTDREKTEVRDAYKFHADARKDPKASKAVKEKAEKAVNEMTDFRKKNRLSWDGLWLRSDLADEVFKILGVPRPKAETTPIPLEAPSPATDEFKVDPDEVPAA